MFLGMPNLCKSLWIEEQGKLKGKSVQGAGQENRPSCMTALRTGCLQASRVCCADACLVAAFMVHHC